MNSKARPLRSSDLMEALAAVESSVPVGDWTVAGIPLWPLLRVRWSFAEWLRTYTTVNPESGSGHVLRTMLNGRRDAGRARTEDAAAEDNGPRRRDVVLLSDGLSFSRVGDHWVERFCDPIIAAAQERGLSTALWTPMHRRHRPRASPSTWVQSMVDVANLTGALRARLWPHAARLEGLDRAIEMLHARGFSGAALQPGRIASDGARLHAVAALYRRRLLASAPRLAFVVSYYSLEGMAFVLACRQCGIPVVDVQHGVQGPQHPAYAQWHSADAGGHQLLPDRFWVWSEWEADVISTWAKGGRHGAIAGGNPWLDLWREGATWPGAAAARAQAAELKRRAQNRPVVLVTLQTGLSPSEQLDPLVALQRSAGDRLEFWVRLHPAMLDQREQVRPALAASGAHWELDRSTDLPLHALLPHSDVHLTHSSTTVVEAAQFGIRSVLTSDYGVEFFTPVLEAGLAVVEPEAGPELVSRLLQLSAADKCPQDIGAFGLSRTGSTLDHLLADVGGRRSQT